MDPAAALSAAGYSGLPYSSYANLAALSSYAAAAGYPSAAAAMLPSGSYTPNGGASASSSLYNPFSFDPRAAAALLSSSVAGSSFTPTPSLYPPYMPSQPSQPTIISASPSFPLGLLPSAGPGGSAAVPPRPNNPVPSAAAAALLMSQYQQQVSKGPVLGSPATVSKSLGSNTALLTPSNSGQPGKQEAATSHSGSKPKIKKEEENERKRREYQQVMKSRTESLLSGAGAPEPATPVGSVSVSKSVVVVKTSQPAIPPPAPKESPLQEALNRKKLALLSQPNVVRHLREAQKKVYAKKWLEEGFPNLLDKKLSKPS